MRIIGCPDTGQRSRRSPPLTSRSTNGSRSTLFWHFVTMFVTLCYQRLKINSILTLCYYLSSSTHPLSIPWWQSAQTEGLDQKRRLSIFIFKYILQYETNTDIYIKENAALHNNLLCVSLTNTFCNFRQVQISNYPNTQFLSSPSWKAGWQHSCVCVCFLGFLSDFFWDVLVIFWISWWFFWDFLVIFWNFLVIFFYFWVNCFWIVLFLMHHCGSN